MGLVRAVALLGLIALPLVAGPVAAVLNAPPDDATHDAASITVLRQARRIEPDGTATPVTLPQVEDLEPGASPPVRARYVLPLMLGPAPGGLSLLIPGLMAHARIAVNGQVLDDRLGDALAPLPRSVRRIVWLRVPDAAVRAGANTIEIDAAGPEFFSLSPVQVGPSAAIERRYNDRVLGAFIAPALVATTIACIAACVLVLWVRRRHETIYGYFGLGGLLWGLHSAWSLLPVPLLSGVHYVVWWTSMYSFFVAMLVIFGVRFAGLQWRDFARGVWALTLATPLLLYGADAWGALQLAAELSRLASIALVAIALGAVSVHAWRHRDPGSLLMLSAGVMSFLLGLRDWQVAHAGLDNNPIYLTPYAGLPFIALMAWVLVDGFVKATRELESANVSLEQRVAQKSAELRSALESMREAKEAAETADQAKSRFLAAASHDLRQPIHALGLYLAAIPVEHIGSSERETLQRMGGSLTALDTMLDALLDISRIDAGVIVPDRQPFELEALLRRIGDDQAPAAEAKGLRLVLRGGLAAGAPGGGPALQAWSDPVLIERIVRNLVANAVRYTETGGVLLSWRLRVGAAPAAPSWQIEVWDTGRGIADAHHEQVFDEFYRVGDTAADGTNGLGLGLSIVRRLSRLMGLPLRMRSQLGRGTHFMLLLPSTPRPAPARREVAVAPLPVGRWVAVIEDDPEVRAAMRLLLQGWHCHLVEGASLAEALQQWHAAGQPVVEAIVADFRLPEGGNGLDAIGALRHAFGDPRVPALVVTGDAAPERIRALVAGGVPWVAKPVSAARLRSWLSAALQPHPHPPAALEADA